MSLKYKVGDRVKIIGNQSLVNFEGIIIDIDNDEIPYLVKYKDVEEYFCEADLVLVEKTLDNLEVGNILITNINGERKILAICDELFGLSCVNNFEILNDWYTLSEIKECYKLKDNLDTHEITELTLEDIAKLAGKDVSQIKIVK